MEGCLSEERVAEFVSGRLAAPLVADVERHLDGCAACLGLVARTASAVFRPATVDETIDTPDPRPARATPLAAGEHVGRYLIRRVVGAGGMGVVYEAHDPALNRKVALKLLRSELCDGSAGVRNRLLREAHAMARLAHPNVVNVFDLGMYGDQIFVAMELVAGETLGAWRTKPRRYSEVARAFLDAGRGLAAAHAAGLVHRDFKPENVLLAGGRARVSDFGLACPVADGERGVVGTPAYMPPEQIRGHEVDARADVFSFCVALWEALYGERPFAGSDLPSLLESIEAGRTGDPPAGRAPARLRALLARGLKARAAERPALDELLVELARDPAAARRRWLAVAGAIVVAAAGAALGLGGMRLHARSSCGDAAAKLAGVWDAQKRAALATVFARAGAGASWPTVEKSLAAYATAWARMHGEACRATRVDHEQSEELLDLRMSCLASRRAELRALTDGMASADAATLGRATEAAAGLPRVEECADVVALSAPVPLPRDAAARARADEARAQIAEAEGAHLLGRYVAADALATQALATARAIRAAPVEAEALYWLGLIANSEADGARAEKLFEEAATVAEEARHDLVRERATRELVEVTRLGSRFADAHRWARQSAAIVSRLGDPPAEVASLANNVGMLYEAEGHHDEAQRELDRTLMLRRKIYPPTDPEIGSALVNLGVIYEASGKYKEALAAYEEGRAVLTVGLGPRHPAVAKAINNIGCVLFDLSRFREALRAFEETLAIREEVLGPDHADVGGALDNVGNARSQLGDHRQAMEAHERALAIARRQGDPLTIAHAELNLSIDYSALGDGARAIALGEDALARRVQTLGAAHSAVALAAFNLGSLFANQGRYGEARPHIERAIAISEKALGADHPSIADMHDGLGLVLRKTGRPREALVEYQRALAIREAKEGESTSMAVSLTGIGVAQLELGVDARTALERARRLEANSDDVAPGDRADTAFALARLRAKSGARDEARALAEEAVAGFVAAGPLFRRDAATVKAWIAAH
jgi:tetratricopeptide (TPR) repeat protein